MRDINKILKAINLADYDGHRSLEVTMEDLLLLREEVLSLRANIVKNKVAVSTLEAKVELLKIDRAVKLDMYI